MGEESHLKETSSPILQAHTAFCKIIFKITARLTQLDLCIVIEKLSVSLHL